LALALCLFAAPVSWRSSHVLFTVVVATTKFRFRVFLLHLPPSILHRLSDHADYDARKKKTISHTVHTQRTAYGFTTGDLEQ
jgi:hypothetical protein